MKDKTVYQITMRQDYVDDGRLFWKGETYDVDLVQEGYYRLYAENGSIGFNKKAIIGYLENMQLARFFDYETLEVQDGETD